MNSPKITKKDISIELSKYMGWTKKKSNNFVDDIFNWIKINIENKKRIIFSGFGTFQLNKRKQRKCIHPISKEKIIIPERWAPQFSPSSSLLKKINSGEII